MSKKTTLKQIAEHAGVSTATVCRVFKTPAKTSLINRYKVEQASNELGYTRNNTNATSAIQSKRQLLIIVSELDHQQHQLILKGAQQASERLNYQLIILNIAKFTTTALINYLSIREILGGILIDTTGDIIASDTPLQETLPLLLINSYKPSWPNIYIDYLSAGFTATNYLISQGHKKIAYLGDIEKSPVNEHTKQGYLQALQRHGITPNPLHIFHKENNIEAGKNILEYILTLTPQPTAIFCHSAYCCLGILHQARLKHVMIPEQLSLICFNDSEIVEQLVPTLSNIKLPLYKMGQLAINNLISKIENKNIKTESILLEGVLNKGQTVYSIK